MIQTIINFQKCATGVEEIQDPVSGEISGRVFVVVDHENNTIYRCTLDLDGAKKLGQQLMGIGSVQVIGGAGNMSEELKREINKRNGAKR